MAGNSFGKHFTITNFGESHGPAIGVVIDGCPAGIDIHPEFIQMELDRRKPGQSGITTQRKEDESFEILSGVFNGKSTGAPIAILIPNKDQKSKDYSHIADKFRPSHADFVYQTKYGLRDYRGGGRSSARETATRVAAGAIAKSILNEHGVSINAYVSQVGHIALSTPVSEIDHSLTESNIVRCPDSVIAQQMIELIEEVKKDGDTIGGKISCIINGVPAGWGEPVFDKLHAKLAQAIMSINAVKGFEYGSGFSAVTMRGTEHNDRFAPGEEFNTTSNFSGGIQGGISNGMPIFFNVAFKPVSTIMKDQKSVDQSGNEVVISGKGRHDPCVVPRAVPIVEAMTAITLTDFYLRSRSNKR